MTGHHWLKGDSMQYGIIEGIDVKLKRIISELDPLVLSTQYTNGMEVSSIVYNVKDSTKHYHDCDDDDKGYFDYYDEYHDRHIFVTGQDIGKSHSFHDDYEIQTIWNVIKPCSNHEHSSYRCICFFSGQRFRILKLCSGLLLCLFPITLCFLS